MSKIDKELNMTELENDFLEQVSGGKRGDQILERASGKPMYSVGQVVEVYRVTSGSGPDTFTITDVEKDPTGAFIYTVGPYRCSAAQIVRVVS